jgi:hypothetical protein
MPKKTSKRNDFLIPNDIAALFGYAPTLKTEDDEIYWNCMERFVKCVEPQDVIEWLWVKDVVDLSWEILRLRRLKIDLIEWPAPGSEDTELGVLMELEVGHGETEVYPRVQA